MHKQIKENSSLLIIGIIFGLLIAFISGLPESLAHVLIRENGIIEDLTFAQYSLYCLIFILIELFIPVFFIYALLQYRLEHEGRC